ncbi:MAG: zinc carboxypeptidase, partial [Thermoplasmata archaeon]|nr:zinc carboxypeptidase [Thermoplasmata archaeon]
SNIAVLSSLGVTYEDRDIWAVKLSDNPLEHEDEPEILYTGAHHGKEWPSYEVPLYFLRFMVENYGKCPTDNDGDGQINEDIFDGRDNDQDGLIDEDEEETRITWLIDNRQLWFVPMLNPDGVAYAHQQVEAGESNQDNLWRKNREPNNNPATGQQYPENVGGKNMWGTDLNRNYGFHWGEIGYQGNADPSREDYIGPLDKTDEDNDRRVNEDKMDNQDNDGDGKIDEDPRGGFSTAETQAIKRLVEEHDFVIALNYHTYAETIYWPWMWTLELTPDEELFCHLAKGMNKFNGYEYRDMSERRQEELSRHPPVDGDSNDWMYGKHGILAYTIELGTQFIPPEEEIIPLCKLHLGSNLLVAEVADDPWQNKFEILHESLRDTPNTDGYAVKIILNRTGNMELKSEGVKVYYSTDGK